MTRKRILIAFAILITMLVFWPWLDSPFNYVRWNDRLRTSIPFALLAGVGPCESRRLESTVIDGKREQFAVIHIDGSPNCRQFDEPRIFQGLWLYEFEDSMFIEGATSVPRKRPSFDRAALLSYDPRKIVPQVDLGGYDKNEGCNKISAFLIRFTGRNRTGPGGHFGLWNSEIWPSKIIEMKAVAAPNCRDYNMD